MRSVARRSSHATVAETQHPRPERAVVAEIRQMCRLLGVPCFRLNSGAMALEGPGRSRRFFRASWKGAPDLVLIHAGRTIWVECKTTKGKLSEHQVEFQRLCAEQNVPHIVARRWEDVEQWVRK